VTAHEVGIARREASVDAWVFGLQGCRAIGDDLEDALSLVPLVIGEHLAWQASHGDAAPDYDIEYKVVEDVDAVGRSEYAFEADKAPLTRDELEHAIRRIEHAQADLVSLAGSLPEVVLDWRPPESSVKIDNIFPDVRSIRDMATHVAQAMNFHLRNVGDVETRVPWPEGEPDLSTALAAAIARIRSMNDEELAGTVYKVPGRSGEAEWTARKALRRVLNHQRFHLKEMQQRLCWLTLGIPDVRPVSRE
jgi:DinB family protein